MSEVITSYSEAQRKYVPEQYKRSEKLLGLIDCDLAMADEIEKALHEIGDSFTLEDAVGPPQTRWSFYIISSIRLNTIALFL